MKTKKKKSYDEFYIDSLVSSLTTLNSNGSKYDSVVSSSLYAVTDIIVEHHDDSYDNLACETKMNVIAIVI